MVTIGETFVERAEHALVETMVLAAIRDAPDGLTGDTVVERVLEFGNFGDRVDRGFVEGSIRRLARGDHVEERQGRYVLTGDGREDVAQVEALLCGVAGAVATDAGRALLEEASRGGVAARRGA